MSCNNQHQNSFMSLKATNDSYRALLAVDGRGSYKETYASNDDKVTCWGNVKSWQSYYRGQRLLVAVLLSGWAANYGNATERVNFQNQHSSDFIQYECNKHNRYVTIRNECAWYSKLENKRLRIISLFVMTKIQANLKLFL